MSQADASRTGDRRKASPFALDDQETYRNWRERKLGAYPRHAADLRTPIADLSRPTAAERAEIAARCRLANMAVYVSAPVDSEAAIRRSLIAFARALGLSSIEAHRSAEADSLVAIEVDQGPAKRGFIPYTNRPLSWHTDGYYNAPDEAVRAMVLHCVRAAPAGGLNALLDPEIAYIRLRDADQRFVRALMHREAMTIPEAREDDGQLRPTSIGPVFSIDPSTGSLLMRYTARGRNILWREDADTRAAVDFLMDLLRDEREPLIHHVRLAPGEGIVCNNVLHTRTAFEAGDGPGRLIYRARYGQRIAGTGHDEAGLAQSYTSSRGDAE